MPYCSNLDLPNPYTAATYNRFMLLARCLGLTPEPFNHVPFDVAIKSRELARQYESTYGPLPRLSSSVTAAALTLNLPEMFLLWLSEVQRYNQMAENSGHIMLDVQRLLTHIMLESPNLYSSYVSAKY